MPGVFCTSNAQAPSLLEKREGACALFVQKTQEDLEIFKCLEAKCREKTWKSRLVWARTKTIYGTKSPSRSEALRRFEPGLFKGFFTTFGFQACNFV